MIVIPFSFRKKPVSLVDSVPQELKMKPERISKRRYFFMMICNGDKQVGGVEIDNYSLSIYSR